MQFLAASCVPLRTVIRGTGLVNTVPLTDTYSTNSTIYLAIPSNQITIPVPVPMPIFRRLTRNVAHKLSKAKTKKPTRTKQYAKHP